MQKKTSWILACVVAGAFAAWMTACDGSQQVAQEQTSSVSPPTSSVATFGVQQPESSDLQTKRPSRSDVKEISEAETLDPSFRSSCEYTHSECGGPVCAKDKGVLGVRGRHYYTCDIYPYTRYVGGCCGTD